MDNNTDLQSPQKIQLKSSDSSIDSSDQDIPLTPKQLQNIDSILKEKLKIHDILELEIDVGKKKRRFDTLYTIKGLLGVGAFGVVIEAINKSTQETIALKVIN